ncbi:MAG: C-GCAxxG-C-C family protein [Bacteroidales bacterium]|jgi:C_GCAxxG_C_C family probable redox protein|nr:C-GCAxxG-C-C family protein [Bacteroidales bacterium]
MSKSHIEIATDLRKEGFNCAQSVFLTFCDRYGLDKDTAARLTASLGSGIAGRREVCGSLLAAALLAGLEQGSADPKEKGKSFPVVNQIYDEFKKENGDIICRRLKGIEKTDIPITPKPCMEYIHSSVALIEKYLYQNK